MYILKVERKMAIYLWSSKHSILNVFSAQSIAESPFYIFFKIPRSTLQIPAPNQNVSMSTSRELKACLDFGLFEHFYWYKHLWGCFVEFLKTAYDMSKNYFQLIFIGSSEQLMKITYIPTWKHLNFFFIIKIAYS